MYSIKNSPFALSISTPISNPIAIPIEHIYVENGVAQINSQIRCFYKLNPNIPGKWLYGVITYINEKNNTCNILYESAGFSITGGGKHVYLVNKFVEY